ncbi:MAG: helicase-related protein, partial [Brasilonema sp.]
ALNSEIVLKYCERDPKSKRKAIAFCANVKQAKDLTLQFLEVGFEAELIVGNTSQDERDVIFENFASGKTRILISVGVLCEGFDEPSADCVLICRPVKSRALFIQMSGRGLRIAPNKEDCWILDYCGNIKRLGIPTQEYPINLCPSPGNPEEDIIPTKTCPNCGEEIYAFLMICPYCGYVFPDEKKKKVAKRGKLEEILTPEQKKHLNYLKSMIVDMYNKEAPNQDIDYAFQKKWGYAAPDDWYDGVLFEGELHGWEVDVQIYYRYLLSFLPSGAPQNREWINKCIQREFRTAIAWSRENFRASYSGAQFTPKEINQVVDARITDLTSYQSWWRILGFDKEPPDLTSVYDAYWRCVRACEIKSSKQKDKPKVLARRVDLYNLALEQAGGRFQLSPKVILQTLNAIKGAIAAQDFATAQRYANSVTLIAKETIWGMLDATERVLFNRYLRGEVTKPLTVVKDSYTDYGKRFYHKHDQPKV